MEEIIRKPAVKIAQGKHTLFATSFTVADFLRGEKFYRVDKLDTEDYTGYQRVLDEARAKSLAQDLNKASGKGEAFLPTSILLATAGNIGYNESSKEISFSVDPAENVCPFLVVDGQHRIEGLRQFSQQNPAAKNFPVAVNIATELDDAQQMLQFLVVNAKQRAVDKGLVQHIISRFTKMKGFTKIPYLPSWVDRATEKGTDAQAVDIVSYLNRESDSPWCGKIKRADDEKRLPEHTINEYPFVKSIKARILSAGNLLARIEDAEKRNKILKNYWIAVNSLFVDGDGNTVVYKTNGLIFFHLVSSEVVARCADLKNFHVETIQAIFRHAHEQDTLAEFMQPGWWQAGEGASKINRAGIDERASAFVKMIRASSTVSGDDFDV